MISLLIGGAGTGAGVESLSSLAQQYGINLNGQFKGQQEDYENSHMFFDYGENRKAQARSLLIDFDEEPFMLSQNSKFREIYSENNSINLGSIPSNNFCKGYNLSENMQTILLQNIRKNVQRCHKFQGFSLFYSSNGGTGSGLSSFLFQKLAEEYEKVYNISFVINPEEEKRTQRDTYNILFSMAKNIQFSNLAVIYDNSALKRISNGNLLLSNTSYSIYNQLIALSTTNILSNKIFSEGVKHYQSKMVFIPQLHFCTTSFSPMVPNISYQFQVPSLGQMLSRSFSISNSLANVDILRSKFLACHMHVRGDISSAYLNPAIGIVRRYNNPKFVQWASTGFILSMNRKPHISPSSFRVPSKTCHLVSNNTSILPLFDRISFDFQEQLNSKQNGYKYVSEGFEQGQLIQAHSKIKMMEQFKQVQIQQSDSEENT